MRKTKLDELPRLINVLKGEMSLVGTSPCLFNQQELLDERKKRAVFAVLPEITGLAQVNDIDMSTPELLAQQDRRLFPALLFSLFAADSAGSGAGDRVRPQ